MGEEPEWYPLIRAARYLRVSPWELAEQPMFWTEVALTAMDAEARADKHRRGTKAKSR